MLRLPHLKQMYIQPMHLTHELIFCIQIKRGRVDSSEIPQRNALALSSKTKLVVNMELSANFRLQPGNIFQLSFYLKHLTRCL